jgi:hypothetical protein
MGALPARASPMVPPWSAKPWARTRAVPDGRERRRVINGWRWRSRRRGRDHRRARIARRHRRIVSRRPDVMMVGHMPVHRRWRATAGRGKCLRLFGGRRCEGWRRGRRGRCRGRRRRGISCRRRLRQARRCRGEHRHPGRRGAANVIPHRLLPLVHEQQQLYAPIALRIAIVVIAGTGATRMARAEYIGASARLSQREQGRASAVGSWDW